MIVISLPLKSLKYTKYLNVYFLVLNARFLYLTLIEFNLTDILPPAMSNLLGSIPLVVFLKQVA